MPDEQTEFGEGRPDLEEVKEMRREHPSGWLELSMDPARALLIDAILDSPEDYTFSPPEIAPRAGISAQSVRNHIGVLVERGVLEKVGDSQYRINSKGRVTCELEQLNNAVTAVRSGAADGKDRSIDPDELMDNSQFTMDHGRRLTPPVGVGNAD